ncbi:serine hydrolase domain-containing protein [Terricaulis sp.]|uniref:serine hydrolase domain-containing protein n=1 Tax=Terricaulis sp. TaxID=2768686 RepID=UPI00378429F1
MSRHLLACAALVLSACATAQPTLPPLPRPEEVDAAAARAMAVSGAQGMAIALIEEGQVVYVNSYGRRNADGDPLQTDTIMYGASLTKVAFAYTVMQLVDEGVIDLDTTIDHYLPKPLPEYAEQDVEDLYARYSDLAGDERWRRITPRMLLTHSSGFANFGFLEPDGRLRIHFDPGSQYSYSGDGMILLQFVLERGLGLDLGREMQRRVFDRFGMTRSSMMWRADFAGNLADGWALDGSTLPHDERSAVRAAGSLDTTITDFAQFAAAFVRGDGLSRAARRDMARPWLPVTVASQFPVLQAELPPYRRRADLASGLGLITFDGPQGEGFIRGGHNDVTANIWVCVEARRRCLVVLSNDVRTEAEFAHITAAILGETGAPWDFLYGAP